jgi:hypothetical protein
MVMIILTGSCSKSDDGSPSNNNNNNIIVPASDVVGYEYNGNFKVAKYWKDGVATLLSDTTKDSQAMSVSISNGNVYIAGVEKNEYGGMDWDNSKRPRCWKNGTSVPLNVLDFGVGVSTNINGVATSVHTYNNNAYIVGYMSDGGCNNYVASLWTNSGDPTLLSSQYDGSSMANSVYVSSTGTVYAVGSKSFTGGNGWQAMLWTNGTEVPLTNGVGVSDAKGVFVSGSDVYICGHVLNTDVSPYARVVYWKNGAINYLSDGTSNGTANSIYVNGNDIYVAGDFCMTGNSSSKATLWKNGTPTTLSNNSISAKSVTVKGSDVYVCGYKYASSTYTATLWINGVEYPLSSGKKDIANDVFVR